MKAKNNNEVTKAILQSGGHRLLHGRGCRVLDPEDSKAGAQGLAEAAAEVRVRQQRSDGGVVKSHGLGQIVG